MNLDLTNEANTCQENSALAEIAAGLAKLEAELQAHLDFMAMIRSQVS